jgi:hypothetical protein
MPTKKKTAKAVAPKKDVAAVETREPESQGNDQKNDAGAAGGHTELAGKAADTVANSVPENGDDTAAQFVTKTSSATVTHKDIRKQAEDKAEAEKDQKKAHKDHADRIFKAIDDAEANGASSASIDINEKFQEAVAALFVEELAKAGKRVEFVDKRGSGRRIMAIGW